jgi:DNA-binding transcriptional ArsR family regulator
MSTVHEVLDFGTLESDARDYLKHHDKYGEALEQVIQDSRIQTISKKRIDTRAEEIQKKTIGGYLSSLESIGLLEEYNDREGNWNIYQLNEEIKDPETALAEIQGFLSSR